MPGQEDLVALESAREGITIDFRSSGYLHGDSWALNRNNGVQARGVSERPAAAGLWRSRPSGRDAIVSHAPCARDRSLGPSGRG